MEPDVPEDVIGGSVNAYFDNEEVFKCLNYECTDEGDDSSEETMVRAKLNYYPIYLL